MTDSERVPADQKSDKPTHITPGDALKALQFLQYVVEKHSDVHGKDVALLAQFIAERAFESSGAAGNTGLPCGNCGAPLPSLSIRKIGAAWDVLIARRVNLVEAKTLIKLLKDALLG